MVKETRFDKHPVRIEKDLYLGLQQKGLAGFYLDQGDSALTSADNSNTTPWDLMDIKALAHTLGHDMPTNAIAVVLDVVVNDAASAANVTAMAFGLPGNILASKCSFVYPGNVNDRKEAKTITVPLSDHGRIAYKIAASGAAFDYLIYLVGWYVAGTSNSRPALPYIDLKCKFSVNQ